MNETKMFHLDLRPEDGAEYAILPGDPGRVPKIAAYLKDAKPVAYNREFQTWSGTLCGERVLVTSTGIGGPSAAIAIEELAGIGVKTMLRVGTCGGMQLPVQGGDLVISTGAIRFEGTSREYVPIEFPAVPDYGVTAALVQAAAELGFSYHTGVTQSKDSFYGQHSPERMPASDELLYKWEAWKKAGCLASEMECAALFITTAVLGCKSGCVLNAIWNQERAKAGLPNPEVNDTTDAIKTAVRALEILINNKPAK